MTLKTYSIAAIPVLAAIMSGVLSAEQGANRPPLPATRGAAVGRKVTLGGVPNSGEVSSTLYRGGHPTEVGFERLAQLGIKIIVDVRGGPSKSEQEQVTKLGMQYVSIPWRCFHPQDQKIAQFLALVEKNRGKKIFVHCRLGDDRTGLMIATHRMAEQGWTAEEAMKEMKAFGFSWAHHYLICPGLASYEAQFPQRFQESPAFQDVRDPGRGAETKPRQGRIVRNDHGGNCR